MGARALKEAVSEGSGDTARLKENECSLTHYGSDVPVFGFAGYKTTG